MKNDSPSTICWDCANCIGKCSWSDGSFKPVKGWKAIKTHIKHQTAMSNDSYAVLYCPQFVRG